MNEILWFNEVCLLPADQWLTDRPPLAIHKGHITTDRRGDGGAGGRQMKGDFREVRVEGNTFF